MAIVKMKKLTLAAPQGDRDRLLNALQGTQCVEVLDLIVQDLDIEGVSNYKDGKAVSQTQLDYNHIKFTYEFLKSHRTEKTGLFDKKDVIDKDEFQQLESKIDWHSIYEKSKEIEEEVNQSKNEKSKIMSLIDQYSLWLNLDVSEKELKALKKVSYLIGSIQKKYEEQLYDDLSKLSTQIYVEKISEKQQDINLLMLCYNNEFEGVTEVLKKYGFSRLNLELQDTPRNIIRQYEEKNLQLDKRLEALNGEAQELSNNIRDIEKIYDYMLSKLEVEDSISRLVKTNKTFIMNGWVPETEVDKVQNTIKGKCKDAFVTFDDPEEGDNPPIVLKNNAINEPFEAITSMYALPLATEIDPTPIIAPFYMLFFGMMMADIGYGALMMVIGIVMLKKMDLDDGLKKIVKLLLYSSIPTIIFGILYGGFFGGIIPLTPIWVNPVDKPMDVLVVSIAIGIVHLFTGLGVKAYELIRDGKILDALMDVGSWYVLLVGLIWMLVANLAGVGGADIAKILAIIGAAAIILTQGRSNKGIFGKLIGGLYSLYGVTGYLGDALSYSRLLALGLSSGLIGWSFNLLIGLFPAPLKYFVGPFIFVAGHTFNFLIGGLGTFVHSSRLIYLEFFGKFYEGGGKAFQPLKISSKFIRVNTER